MPSRVEADLQGLAGELAMGLEEQISPFLLMTGLLVDVLVTKPLGTWIWVMSFEARKDP